MLSSSNNCAAELETNGYLIFEETAQLRDRIARAYEAWRTIFCSSSKFSLEGSVTAPSGYIPLCQLAGCDMKESFYCREGTKFPLGTEEPTRLVIWELKRIAEEIAESINVTYGGDLIQNVTLGCLRVMRYPAFHGAPESELMRRLASEGVSRSCEHTDLNAISLLPSSTAPGLELLQKDGTWKLMDQEPGRVIVHAGQELEERSKRRFIATRHRVRNPIASEEILDRYSMALFIS